MAGSTEAWVSTDAGRHLRARRRRDTGPELELRRALHATGARFRLQRRLAPGCTPDVVLPRRGVAVFVDGCFWHGCPIHGRSEWRGPNASLWKEKMRRNRTRDERSTSLAESLGWTVVRVWECEIDTDASDAARRVLDASRP